MMIKAIYPKTKDELIAALKVARIEKIEVMDQADSRINSLIREAKRPNIKRWVIFIDEKG